MSKRLLRPDGVLIVTIDENEVFHLGVLLEQVFFGYGLGWFGQVGAFGALMLGLPVFALQIVGSQWWLKRFRFGRAEWMWRSATYGKWQAMRLEPLPLAAGVGGAK